MDYVFSLLVTHQYPALVLGPTGTGKSVYVKQFLMKTLPQET